MTAIPMVLGLLSWPSSTDAEGCQCRGTNLDKFGGSDASSLDWDFMTHIVQEGKTGTSPLVCYYKNVTNKSETEVRRIRWEVAGYYRAYLPKKKSLPYCADIYGQLAEAPVTGLLFYGYSRSQFYETTVRKPVNGWPEAATESPSTAVKKAAAKDTLVPLSSTMLVYLADPRQGSRTALIGINSMAEIQGTLVTLKYDFSNEGNTPIRIYVNASVTQGMLNDIPPMADSLLLEPKSKKSFQTRLNDEVHAETAVIVVQDLEYRTVSIDTGSFYVPINGRKLRSDKYNWQALGEEHMN
jgi:hypothetical protein